MLPAIRTRILSGGVWAVGGKFVAGILLISMDHFLATSLTASEVGTFFLIFSLVMFMALVAGLGLPTVAVRMIAERLPEDRGSVQAILLRLSGLILVSGVVVAGLYRIAGIQLLGMLAGAENLAAFTPQIVAWSFILTLLLFCEECFRGFHDIRLASVFASSNTGGLLPGAVLVAFLWFHRIAADHVTLEEVLWVIVGASLVSLILAGYALWMKARRQAAGTGSKPTVPAILSIGWPILLAAVLHFLLTRADVWILAAYAGAQDVAVFGAASRLIRLVLVPLSIVNAVVPPIIAELNVKGSKTRMESVMRATATLGGIPSLLVVSAYLLFGANIISVVYGEMYLGAAIVLAILCVGQLINVLSGSCSLALLMTGNERLNLAIIGASGAFMILVGLAAAKTYGAVGLAVAISFVAVFKNILTVLAVRQRVGVWTFVDLVPSRLMRAVREV